MYGTTVHLLKGTGKGRAGQKEEDCKIFEPLSSEGEWRGIQRGGEKVVYGMVFEEKGGRKLRIVQPF